MIVQFGRVSLAATLLFVLGACAGDRPVAPDGGPVMFSVTTQSETLPQCDYMATRNNARNWFRQNNDPFFTYLQQQDQANKSGNTTLATTRGYDALREMASARGTTRQIGNAALGNTVVRGVLACTSDNTVVAGFSVEKAIAEGVFEVRGGSGDPLLAALAYTASPSSKTLASPLWGAEATSTWAATPNRYLLYGSPIAAFTSEQHYEFGPYGGFELTTHPHPVQFTNAIRVGICIQPEQSSGPVRLLHGSGANTIEPLEQMNFCTPENTVGSVSGTSGLYAFASRALALFAPQPAFAQSRGGVGSLETSLSPFGPVRVFLANGTSTFDGLADGNAGVPLAPFTVTLRSAANSIIAGAYITLLPIDNNGVPTAISGNTGQTDAAGSYTFLGTTISKTGGYRLVPYFRLTVPTPEDPGPGTPLQASQRFNIRP